MDIGDSNIILLLSLNPQVIEFALIVGVTATIKNREVIVGKKV